MTVPAQLDRYTVADLERTPDDGLRYEVINGSLSVTPAPAFAHNRRAQSVGLALLAAAPDGVEVLLTGTQGVQLGDDGLIPDLVVYRAGDYAGYLPAEAVLLVVEVTSPGNRSNDTVLKFERYARAGIPHYWIVDPDAVRAHDLVDGSYRLADEGRTVAVTQPFAVEVTLP